MIPAYGFYPCLKPCPACRGKLLSLTPLRKEFLRGPLQGLGISCFCQICTRRYRATSSLNYSAVAWLGPIGRWLWWHSAALESTSPAPEI